MKTIVLAALILLSQANAQIVQQVIGTTAVQGPPPPSATAHTCTQYTGSSSTTCTFNVNPASGEFIALSVWETGTGTVTVTDSASHSYTSAAALHTATTVSGVSTQMFYYGPLTAGISTITATSTSASGTLVIADTFTGIAGPVDGTICYADATGTTAVNCGTAITTTVANDAIFCAAYASGGGLTIGTGFTALVGSGTTGFSQYKIQATTGSITPTAVLSSSSDTATMSCAAFKP
jgi:hypothetical protein